MSRFSDTHARFGWPLLCLVLLTGLSAPASQYFAQTQAISKEIAITHQNQTPGGERVTSEGIFRAYLATMTDAIGVVIPGNKGIEQRLD